MRKVPVSLLLTALLSVLAVNSFADSDSKLSDEFIDAQPRIQLYMAYAEFKMGNHQLAQQMWLSIGGSGRAEALFNLANMYAQGVGVKQNLKQAVSLYRESAEAGSRSSAYQLGIIYLNSSGFQNEERARYWLTVAALDGDNDAANLLAGLVNNDSSDPMSEVQALLINGETSLALDKLQTLAEARPANIRAITRLAWLYESGLAVERDLARAAELFMQAAEAGDAEAQYAISVMYQTGVGKPQNGQQALYWLERSAAQGFQTAMNKLTDKTAK
ncbi:tetratricopeptide repeat protein [Amphritea japonica]|uniref:Sel1 domain protein n=1 Tax=Amphritea japonica ATCC BAA-1530 TaxID=1278309 RepID=A0A7R6PD39_9GAMM|nr:tetratricopeptide repeat protein [Amphritea japonica]BBB25901.1 Sel1 domain protein [Amphritea japonica ATCC BAA-1530]